MKFFIITKKHIALATAIVVALTAILITSVASSAENNRKLPIYCVETEKKQIAISFDAAWGNSKKVQIFQLL